MDEARNRAGRSNLEAGGRSLALREASKRVFDLAILTVAHLVLAPVFIALWTVIPLLIWLEDRGPVFYRQERPGRGGKPFALLKFRTMVVNADSVGPAWTTDKDPRITRIGRILRKTALDELPGVLSIWKGSMSFVGPRALPKKEQEMFEREIEGFSRRLRIRPGLTGLAQVYDQVDDARTKLRYDLEYIDRMSLALDVKLVVLSVRNTMMGKWDTRTGKTAA